MKRYISLALVSALVMFAGCNQKSDNQKEPTNKLVTPVDVTATVTSTGEEISISTSEVSDIETAKIAGAKAAAALKFGGVAEVVDRKDYTDNIETNTTSVKLTQVVETEDTNSTNKPVAYTLPTINVIADKIVSEDNNVSTDDNNSVKEKYEDIKPLTQVVVQPEVTQAAINLDTCKNCHGQNFEKSALGKSRIVKDLSYDEISKALKGYKDGTYGGVMKGLMNAQLTQYSEDELYKISLQISSK